MKKKLKWFLLFLLVAYAIYIFIENIILNCKFNLIAVDSIIIPFLTILFGFIFAQLFQNDNQKKKRIENILDDVQQLISSKDALPETLSNNTDYFILQRKLSNKIYLFNLYAKEYSLQKESEYIQAEFDKYCSQTSLLFEKTEQPDSIYNAMKIHMNNILSKCESAIFKLYD